MLSKSQERFVRSLQRQKARDRWGVYVIEGDKMVSDYLEAQVPLEHVFAAEDWGRTLPGRSRDALRDVSWVTSGELRRLSALVAPQHALAVVRQPREPFDPASLGRDLSLALEFVQDPGNLGSVLRIAAWFGIRQIVCSPDCVDVYNPKAVQASMGALLHVRVHYAELEPVLGAAASQGVPTIGTVLDGESIYTADLANRALIVLGNESRGLSDEVRARITRGVTIPSAAPIGPGRESLNVAMAAAVVCSEWRRRGARAQGTMRYNAPR